jgi:phage baseplate assembly protein W
MMNAATGQWLDLDAHIYQSIDKIINTLKGTRIHRRAFGSLVPSMVDQAPTPAILATLRAALALEVMRWERRFTITQIAIEPSEGKLNLSLQGTINDKAVQFQYTDLGGTHGNV